MNKKKIGPNPLLMPMPVVIIGARMNNKPSFVMVTGCNVTLQKSLSFAVPLEKDTYILEGIDKYGVFSINVPPSDLIEKVDNCSVFSEMNSAISTLFNIVYGTLEGAPLIEECPVNHECKAEDIVDLNTHLLIIGEVIETHVDKHCLAYGALEIEKVAPVCMTYTLVSNQYRQLGRVLKVRRLTSKGEGN